VRRNTLLALTCLLLVILCAGCSKPTGDPEALYEQIEAGMSVDAVFAIMEDHEPFTESESTVNTAAGQIVMKTVSWKIGKHIIIVIFENGALQSKDLSKM
jgi:hypothetical protein